MYSGLLGERSDSRRLEERSSSKADKKGDLSLCGNWRGIMLLSIPSKVFTRVILNRMKVAVDEALRDEQVGFRKDRSCINHNYCHTEDYRRTNNRVVIPPVLAIRGF